MVDERAYDELIRIDRRELSNFIDVHNGEIYHYTSPSGLNGIMSNHTLRFTDRNYLNDYSEGRYVIDLCLRSRFELKLPKEYRCYFKRYCEKIYNNPTKKKRYVYQCSFSTKMDNLSLWNYYTKSNGIKGYNLGFNSEKLSNELNTRGASKGKGLRVFHGKIVYSKKTQKEIIKKVVEDYKGIIEENKINGRFCEIAIEILVEKILFVGAFFKDPCFKHENEYRLLLCLMPYLDDNNIVKFMVLEEGAKTYEKNGLLIPYIDIEFPVDNLKSISISPTLSFDETEGNLVNALKIHGYNENSIQIIKSKIPIRY